MPKKLVFLAPVLLVSGCFSSSDLLPSSGGKGGAHINNKTKFSAAVGRFNDMGRLAVAGFLNRTDIGSKLFLNLARDVSCRWVAFIVRVRSAGDDQTKQDQKP